MRRSLKLMGLLAALACQPAAQGNTDTTPNDSAGAGAGNTTGAHMADSGRVSLSLDKMEYAPGARASMSISSQRTDTLGFNPCSDRFVERETAGGWVVHPEPNRMCTMEIRMLNPGETQTAQTDVPADASAGTYRIVLRLRPERADSAPSGVTVAAASAPFRVVAP